MNIGIVYPDNLLPQTGTTARTLGFVNALVKRNHRVVLFVRGRNSEEDDLVRLLGAEYIPVPVPRSSPHIIGSIAYVVSLISAFRVVEKRVHLDLLHFVTLGLSQFSYPLFRGLFGIPLVSDVHAVTSARFVAAGLPKSYFQWIYGLAFEAVALKFSDLIITPTDESEKALRVKFGRGLISAIPNCFWSKKVNMKSASSENKKRNQEYVVFFHANFMPGPLSMLRSIPEAKRTSQVVQQLNCRGHNVKLWIAGPGSENLTEELGPITNLGYVDDPFAYLLRSDLVILPVRDQTLGIHSRLIEAMTAGKPIVATREACCGITPYLTEAGILVCDTLQEMVDSACSVIEDSGIRKILGERNRQLAERLFSPQSVGLKLEQAYQAVLKGKQLRQLDSAEV